VGNHISYNRLGGVRIENSEIRNLQITGNDMEYNNNAQFRVPNADDVPTAEIFIDCGENGTVREMTISGNTLQATYSPRGANIYIAGADTPEQQRAGMCSITGNLIGSQAVNVHLKSCRGVVLEGNYIYSGHRRNVLIESSRNIVIGSNCLGHNPDYKELELCTGIRLVDCSFVAMTGLQIQDAQAGQHTVKEAVPVERKALVELVHCRQVNLTGVQIFEGSPQSLHLEDCDNTVIAGCTILDTREKPQTEHSIHWTGKTQGSLIANCRLNRPLKLPENVVRNGLVEG
jgi:polygalacturonase